MSTTTETPTAPPEGTMYTLTDVTKQYRARGRTVTALDSVSLTVAAGELLAIQGQTGGGKSTLLQLLGALDRPSTGTVALGDDDLTRLSAGRLARLRGRRIGFVFQAFNLIPTLTALENVETALVPLHVPAAQRRERASAALASLRLEERMRHYPSELSGGQQQRVALARALVTEPEVLLADEPTGNLDEATRDEIMDLILSLWRERGLTVVLVTHDSTVAARATRRLRLDAGVLTAAA